MTDHIDESEAKQPLSSQVMTGYMMSKARKQGIKYYKRALKCMKQAVIDTNDDLGAELVQNVDLGGIRSAIYDAMAAIERVEVEHAKLSIDLQALGYPKLSSKDFEKFGATGR